MRFNGGKLRLLVAVLAVACVGTGCSSSGAGTSEAEAEDHAYEVQRILSKPDCRAIERMTRQSAEAFGAFPSQPCPSKREARRTLRDFDVKASTTYGPTAVVDYTSEKAPRGASMVLVRNRSGDWVLSAWGLGGGVTSKTDDKPNRAGYDRAVKRFAAAVRKNDCKAFFRHAITRFPKAGTACAFELPTYKDFASGLRKSPRARPEYLGGNGTFGFYRLVTARPERVFWTMTAIKARPGERDPFAVLNVARGPKPE